MTRVVVPVRQPLNEHSKHTLSEAIRLARERDATLIVLHVNLYQHTSHVSRTGLKRSVEAAFGRVPNARYVVRTGFLVEETILEEVAAEEADIVVIGHQQKSRWRRMLRRLVGDPDVENYLRRELDCQVVTARC